MGATQSTPSRLEGSQFPTTSPPRNKLTKPRTNSNNTRETSCLPSLPLSLSRPSFLGISKSSSAAKYQTIVEDQSSGSIFAIEYSQTIPPAAVTDRPSGSWDLLGGYVPDHPTHVDSLHLGSISALDSTSPGVVSPTLLSNGMLRRGSMVTRSSTNSSSACAPPPNRNSEIPSMGTVRRRSQLLAAPPATATRKPTKSHRHSMDISDISPDPFTLATPSGNDIGRCTTPSGYSVLGAFKRGSLRIANGTASPAPSSCPGSPDASTRNGFFGPTLVIPEAGSIRPSSRVKPVIVVPSPVIPIHEVRLVPPSPVEWSQTKDEKVPGSPFSFMQSPSVCDEDILDLPLGGDQTSDFTLEDLQPLPCGHMDSCESLVSTTPSTISTGIEYHRILTEQCLNWRRGKHVRVGTDNLQTVSPVLGTGADEYHNVLFGEGRKESDRRLRRPSMAKVGSEGTDSGYSSSGSVNSRKPGRGYQETGVGSNVCESGNPSSRSKVDTVSVAQQAEVVAEMDKISRTKGMAAAIRRRYSQGDLKASARSMEFTSQLPVPRAPAPERKRTLTKPRPELKHRRSMIATTRSLIQQPEIQKLLPAIAPVPPLPYSSRLERKDSFNVLTLEDYLSLVGDLPFTPVVDHTPDMVSISSAGIETDTRESIIKIGIGRELYRGSRITGQDYHQRFSSRQHASVETIVR